MLAGLKLIRLPRCVPMKEGHMLNEVFASSISSSLFSSSRFSFVVASCYLFLCGRLTMTCSMRGVLRRLVVLFDLLSSSSYWTFASMFERASSAYISMLSGSGYFGVLLDLPPKLIPSWYFYSPLWLASGLLTAYCWVRLVPGDREEEACLKRISGPLMTFAIGFISLKCTVRLVFFIIFWVAFMYVSSMKSKLGFELYGLRISL